MFSAGIIYTLNRIQEFIANDYDLRKIDAEINKLMETSFQKLGSILD